MYRVPVLERIANLGSEELAITVFSPGEFWSVVTRRASEVNTRAVRARAFLQTWIIGGRHILLPGAGYWPIFEQLLDRLKPPSRAIFDCQILATCIEHEVRQLWTFDERFPRDRRVRVVNPLGR